MALLGPPGRPNGPIRAVGQFDQVNVDPVKRKKKKNYLKKKKKKRVKSGLDPWIVSACKFKGNKIRNHILYLTPLKISDKEEVAIDTVFCLPSICVSDPKKNQKYHFLSTRPWERLEQRVATRLSTEAPEVPFSAKMTKTPLVSLGFYQRSNEVQTFAKRNFHSFTSNPSFSNIFNKFDQGWPKVNPE